MRRREVFTGSATLAAAAAAGWQTAAHAQAGLTRRLGFLMVVDERPVRQGWARAAIDRLASLGWREGENLQVDLRWGFADADRIARATQDILSLKPDVVLAQVSRA